MIRAAAVIFGILSVKVVLVYGQGQSATVHWASGVGVPAQYSGKWVCQSAVPGYNLPFPNASGPAPSTQRMTTPPSTAVLTFTLHPDGTYEAPNARGHYSYHGTNKRIDWLDGLYQHQFSGTELSNRSNGEPALEFHAFERYFGCYLAEPSRALGGKPQESAATQSRPPASPGQPRYTKEEFLKRGREGATAYNHGDYITARSIFEDLVEADPNSADAHAALGALLTQIRENDHALVQLNRALELNPQELSAYVNRGEVYLRFGRRSEAEADLKKAISFDSTGKNPVVNRARGLLKGTIHY